MRASSVQRASHTATTSGMVVVAGPKGKPVAGVPVRLTWQLRGHDFPQGSPRSTGKDGHAQVILRRHLRWII